MAPGSGFCKKIHRGEELMRLTLSDNTKAVLLLTSPLLVGRTKSSAKPFGAGPYHDLACRLYDKELEPAALLTSDWQQILKKCRVDADLDRLGRLLDRSVLLAQAVERWQARSIWVVSRADADYPQHLEKRLQRNTPPILYGCGDAAILRTGGLAIVGSRSVNDTLIAYAEGVGRLAAEARQTLVSGGARGVDQAGMRGALDAGGRVVGVLGDSLERTVVHREHRDFLMRNQLVLISSSDPAARFHVGYAMQRNKLIYALAHAALVVSSDYNKGGTWTGAVEELEKPKHVPIFIRDGGEAERGLRGLQERGAEPWPKPDTPDELEDILKQPVVETDTVQPQQAMLGFRKEPVSSESGEAGVAIDDHTAARVQGSDC